MPPETDLMDTNIFVHMIRNDATGRFLKEKYKLLVTQPTPAYCIVTEGELRSLIYWFKWGEDKSEQVRYYLEYFRPVSIETPPIYDAYASIDHYSKSRGIKMGKNDLWIAAVASVTKFRLLTTDADFDHLAPLFLTRLRITYD